VYQKYTFCKFGQNEREDAAVKCRNFEVFELRSLADGKES